MTPESSPIPPIKRPNTGSKIFFSLAVPAVILGGLFTAGFLPRIERAKELKEAHQETVEAIPVVHTIQAKPAEHNEAIVLPGNIGAIQYTTIYARVDGYLKSRLVDIGDYVKPGQLLAQIDTPTIDAQVDTAKADLAKAAADLQSSKAQLKETLAQEDAAKANVEKAKANVAYTSITAKRWTDLCAKGAVSQQSRDEKVRSLETSTADLSAVKADLVAAHAQVLTAESNVNASVANVNAKKSDLTRTTAKQNFKNVVAPFEGVITLRKVDPGALITEGSGSSNLELFQLAHIDRLRIYVAVPQRVARYLKSGMHAEVMVSEFPEQTFDGIVTNVSGALDPNTRTRQTEIQIDNKKHTLLPGMYADVKMVGLRDAPWIRVAGTCIVTKPEGQFVVVVREGKAHFQPITIGRDFGNEVEIKTGLTGDEQVVVSPNDDLREGDPVKIQIAAES